MQTDEIIRGNKKLAVFMGGKYASETMVPLNLNEIWLPYWGISKFDTIALGAGNILEYHKSWNWLMPVVEKIESLPGHPFHGKFGVHITRNSCAIQGTRLRIDPDNPNYAYTSEHFGETKLEATWWACSVFLDWYKGASY